MLLALKLLEAGLAHSDGLFGRRRHGVLRRALGAEYVPTVSAVVLPDGDGETFPAGHAVLHLAVVRPLPGQRLRLLYLEGLVFAAQLLHGGRGVVQFAPQLYRFGLKLLDLPFAFDTPLQKRPSLVLVVLDGGLEDGDLPPQLVGLLLQLGDAALAALPLSLQSRHVLVQRRHLEAQLGLRLLAALQLLLPRSLLRHQLIL